MRLAQQQPARKTRQANAKPINTDRLDSMLGQLEDEHTNLLGLAKAHKDAITHASVHELNDITNKTSEVLVRIAQIEDNRREMMTQSSDGLSSLDELMKKFNTHDKDRISKRQQRLRSLIGQVKEEQEAVKVASENLANHMRGLMQQVGASLSHTGTYSRGGGVESARAQVVSSLDMVQ